MGTREGLMRAMSNAVEKHVAEGQKKGAERAAWMAGMSFLVERIEQLEAQPFEYAGRYYSEKTYRKNQMLSHNGRLWICTAGTTREQPGGNCVDWDMVANKGRDGKDAS